MSWSSCPAWGGRGKPSHGFNHQTISQGNIGKTWGKHGCIFVGATPLTPSSNSSRMGEATESTSERAHVVFRASSSFSYDSGRTSSCMCCSHVPLSVCIDNLPITINHQLFHGFGTAMVCDYILSHLKHLTVMLIIIIHHYPIPFHIHNGPYHSHQSMAMPTCGSPSPHRVAGPNPRLLVALRRRLEDVNFTPWDLGRHRPHQVVMIH